jgi:hypothetical protein
MRFFRFFPRFSLRSQVEVTLFIYNNARMRREIASSTAKSGAENCACPHVGRTNATVLQGCSAPVNATSCDHAYEKERARLEGRIRGLLADGRAF